MKSLLQNKMQNNSIIIFFLILLTGCASVKDPIKVPMTLGLIEDQKIELPPQKVKAGPEKNLALILSQNTKNSFAFMKQMQSYWAKRSQSVLKLTERDQAVGESFSPQIYTSNITDALKKYFGKITVINDISQFDSSYDYLVIVDVFRSYTGTPGLSENAISEINTAFYDHTKKLINIANASVSELNENEYQGYKVTIKSIDIWKNNLNTIIQNGTKNSTFNYDTCMRQALAIKDKSLKSQAMSACEQERNSSR